MGELIMLQRSGGILLHISSLPSPYGIGTFGQAAYDFVDFLIVNQYREGKVKRTPVRGVK